MLTTKLVVRVLDAGDQLLGWSELRVEARGDGALWAPAPTVIPIEQSGRAAVLSLHLADINVERREAIDVDVWAGRVLTLPGPGQLFVLGEPPVSLPPVTVRGSVSISVPVGSLGAAAI